MPTVSCSLSAVSLCAADETAETNLLGQAEIENFRVAALGDENVGGLDIAMNDSLRVRGVESIGDFDGEIEKYVEIERVAADAMLQRHSLHVFHADEHAAFVLADFVDRANVGVIQS